MGFAGGFAVLPCLATWKRAGDDFALPVEDSSWPGSGITAPQLRCELKAQGLEYRTPAILDPRAKRASDFPRVPESMQPAVESARGCGHGFGSSVVTAGIGISRWVVSTNFAGSLDNFGPLAPCSHSIIRERSIFPQYTPKRPRGEGSRQGKCMTCCFTAPRMRQRRFPMDCLRRNRLRGQRLSDFLIFV